METKKELSLSSDQLTSLFGYCQSLQDELRPLLNNGSNISLELYGTLANFKLLLDEIFPSSSVFPSVEQMQKAFEPNDNFQDNFKELLTLYVNFIDAQKDKRFDSYLNTALESLLPLVYCQNPLYTLTEALQTALTIAGEIDQAVKRNEA